MNQDPFNRASREERMKPQTHSSFLSTSSLPEEKRCKERPEHCFHPTRNFGKRRKLLAEGREVPHPRGLIEFRLLILFGIGLVFSVPLRDVASFFQSVHLA